MADNMKRFQAITFSLVFVLAVFITGFSPPGLTDADLPTTVLTPEHVEMASGGAQPDISAVSAIAIDADTGQVLYEKDAHLRRAPASTTKMLTALLALENSQLDEQVKVEYQDLVGGSTMGLMGGDTVAIKDMLYGMLLPSGNDAAEAVARFVGSKVNPADGTRAFVDMMNARLVELGLTNTHFTNAEGADEPDHYSTAWDLAGLTRYAMLNPVFAEIVATPSYATQSALATYEVINTNELIGSYEGANGVKTGTTDNAGECLVASVDRDGHRVISVVLGSVQRFVDSRAILDSVFARYRWVNFSPKPDAILRLQDNEGRWRPLAARGENWRLITTVEADLTRMMVTLSDPLPADSSAPAAWARYYIGGRLIHSVPLYLEDATPPSAALAG